MHTFLLIFKILFLGTIRKLLPWLEKNLLKERPELFLQEETVRPGILVLVNDADWELLVCLQSIYNMISKIFSMFKRWSVTKMVV